MITPLAPDLTRVENRMRVKDASEWEFYRQEQRSAGYWKRTVRGKYEDAADPAEGDDPLASGDFTAEDVLACERQQLSLRSPYFEVGPASRGEGPVLEHQEVVLRFLDGHTR